MQIFNVLAITIDRRLHRAYLSSFFANHLDALSGEAERPIGFTHINSLNLLHAHHRSFGKCATTAVDELSLVAVGLDEANLGFVVRCFQRYYAT